MMYWRDDEQERKISEGFRTYVEPVALSRLEGCALEAKGTLPATGFLRVFRQRKLALVVIPCSEKVNSLDIGGGAQSEAKLSRRHFDYCWLGVSILEQVVDRKE